MSSSITNIGGIQQNFMNNIVQEDQQNCLAAVTSQANNNIFILNGANIEGDFTGVAPTINTDATCLMVSNMDTTIQNIVGAILQQTNTAATDWLNGGQITKERNVFNIEQSITNNISQINEATCSASVDASESNNYFYVGTARIGGNFVGVAGTTNASANCSMSNAMKNATYNQAQASATQSNTEVGMFVAIVTAIVTIVGLLVFGVIILFATGALRHVGYSAAAAPQVSQEEQDLVAARDLGLTPDILQTLTEPVPV